MKLFDLEISNEMVNESNVHLYTSDLMKDLSAAYRYLRDKDNVRTVYSDTVGLKMITDAIFKHTSIKMEIVKNAPLFAMMPPDLNRNHVLLKEAHEIKGYYSAGEVRKKQGKIEGSIDLKNFKVGGDFSKMTVQLYIDPYMIFDTDYRDEVLAAITMHEVGHAFSYFALSAHQYSANLPLLNTLNKITNTENTEEIKLILKEWNGYSSTTTKVSEDLATKDKRVIVEAIVVNKLRDERSITKHTEYDKINSEHLADKFAVRMGAGTYLAEGLDILNRTYGSRYRGLANFIGYELKLFTYGFFTLLLPETSGQYKTRFHKFLAILLAYSNTSDGVYDHDVNRFTRIRNDMVSMLKDETINKSVGERIRNDIKELDDILSNYKHYISAFGYLVDLVVPSKRRLLAQTELYEQLEALSSNQLFVAAYDLRTTADS